MKQSDYTMRVLTPEEGHYLTQAEEVSLSARIVTNQPLYLAVTDSPENWREIPAEEAEAILAARQSELEEMKRRETQEN